MEQEIEAGIDMLVFTGKESEEEKASQRRLMRVAERIHTLKCHLEAENRYLRARVEDLEDIVARYLEEPSEYRRKRIAEEKRLIQRAEEVIRKQNET